MNIRNRLPFIRLRAWLSRKIPVRRSWHAAQIRGAASYGDELPVYEFMTRIPTIRWSTEAMPDLLTRHILFEGLYQEDVVEALLGLSPRGGVVFDIGAHHGFMSLVAALAVGADGRVAAFEPNPLSIRHLERNLARNRSAQVEIVSAAVGDRIGTVSLNIQKGTATWNTSIYQEFIQRGYEIEQREVPMTTIDAYVRETGLVPNVMKIDVEGAECLVLKGAQETIERHRPALIMEFNPAAAQAAGTTIGELVNGLFRQGYRLFALRRNRWGRYSFKRQEPFDEKRHCRDDLANVVCISEE